MKLRALVATGLASAVLGLAAMPAQANVEYDGQYTYLGSFTTPPGVPNSESFSRDQEDGFPLGAFDDYWIFDLAPTANGQLSVNFVPIGAIANFFGGIYEASGFAGCTVGVACAGGAPGALVVEAGAPVIFGGVQALLPAGQYAVRVRGDNLSNQTSYTGQVAFLAVPEPGSLALLGLGLVGLALVRRRAS